MTVVATPNDPDIARDVRGELPNVMRPDNHGAGAGLRRRAIQMHPAAMAALGILDTPF
jgi:hypothetical protein